MSKITDFLDGVNVIGMAGLNRPDGVCVGSCLGVYTYLRYNLPDSEIDLYLEEIPDKFDNLKYASEIINDTSADKHYDLFITLDASDLERIGGAVKYFNNADKTLCIDHHVSNKGFADTNIIEPESSSACETLFFLLYEDKIHVDVATNLYLGIIHDSGVFKYSCTSLRTMTTAGKLMEKGIPFTDIIDDTFYTKTYVQNQIMGRALMESVLFYEGQCIFSVVKSDEFEFYNITSKDLDGIVEQLRITKGVEVAIFLYQTNELEYKISLRSKNKVDVSAIASYFGGGGHVRAAGCTMHGTVYDVINNISERLALQLD